MAQQKNLIKNEEEEELRHLILSKFAPNFAPTAQVFYQEDSSPNVTFLASKKLDKLGVHSSDMGFDKFPELILYNQEKNWLYLIAVATDHGHFDNLRKREMEQVFKSTTAGLIFITAFLTKASFRKFADDIAWETEVWIAENPKHMIHFNGDRFMGPR